MTYPKNHQKNILSLLDKDQKNIRLFREGSMGTEEIKKESENISNEFMEIINDAGFPFLNITPSDVYEAAIVLSLHLPTSGLNNMFNKIKDSPLSTLKPEHMAYFTDKILIHSGKKQKYGTQYKINSKGGVGVLPIEDYLHVDIRRAELGLETLEEYQNKIKREITYSLDK